MGYVYDDLSGRITAVYPTDTPTPPAGHSFSPDLAPLDAVLDSRRDILGGVLVKRDKLAMAGSNSILRGAVGQVAVQKIDGTTLVPKTAPADDDPVVYALDDPVAFLNKRESALVEGADSVKVAAPLTPGTRRFLVRSPELQLLDSTVVIT